MTSRQMMNALLSTIAEVGDKGAPEGPMYAALMGRIGLDTFNAMLATFAGAGLITREHYLVRPTAALTEAYDRAKAKAEVRS